MGKGNPATKHVRSGTSGESTPEARSVALQLEEEEDEDDEDHGSDHSLVSESQHPKKKLRASDDHDSLGSFASVPPSPSSMNEVPPAHSSSRSAAPPLHRRSR